MHNLSDEELDRLSREAAEVNQTPVSPGGWDMISSRLDQEMPVRYEDKTLYLRIATDLLLLLAFAYIGLFQPSSAIQHNAANVKERNSTQTISSEENQNKLSNAAGTQADGIKDGGRLQSIDEVPAKVTVDVNNPTSSIAKGPGKDAGVIQWNEAKNKKSSNNVRPDQKLIPGTINQSPVTIDQNKTISNGRVINTADNSGISKSVENKDGSLNADDKNSSAIITTPGIQNPNVSQPAATQKTNEEKVQVQSAPADSAAKIITKKTGGTKTGKSKSSSFDGMTGNFLQIGVTWSPDFSKVGSAKPVDIGHTFGITAGYEFNRRWSIQSGLLYTKKYYTSEGGSYGKVPGYPTYDPYLKIKKVNAECYMLDIPINVRYNWLLRRKSRAFASAGFTSYLMKEEDLHYWYTYYNNPKYKQWTNEANSNYWFAVGNISAGFEQFITPSISIQAEPFLKLSLRDIGYGQVKINSAGFFLGIKYTPPLHLSKK